MNSEEQEHLEALLRKAAPLLNRGVRMPDGMRERLDKVLDLKFPQRRKLSVWERVLKGGKKMWNRVWLPKWRIARVAGFAALILACAAYLMFVYVPRSTAVGLGNEVSEDVKDMLGIIPQVTFRNEVIVAEKKEISELATAQKTVSVTLSFEDRWLHSKKTLEAKGVFTAKAGFDLQSKSCNVTILEHPLRVIVSFPKPILLSATPKSIEILKDENGLWNRINPQEREQLVRELTPAAIRYARDTTSLLTEAQENVKKQLEAKAAAKNWQLEVIFR